MSLLSRVAVGGRRVIKKLEAHYGVPMAGEVLKPLNYPLDARTMGVIIGHGVDLLLIVFFVFFFKQKTAYEMAQCDWSSDVCSSDLARRDGKGAAGVEAADRAA